MRRLPAQLFFSAFFGAAGAFGTLSSFYATVDLVSLDLPKLLGSRPAFSQIRSKRQQNDVTGPASSNSDPYPGSFEIGRCVLPCMNSMQATLQGLGLSPGLQTSLDLTGKFYSEEAFGEFCGAYVAAKACVGACPDSLLKGTLHSAFAALEYLCVAHYDEFVSYLPCYRASDVEIQRNCGPLCGLETKMRSTKARLQSAQAARDLDHMSRIMDEMCEAISCQFSCLQPIVYAECGNWNASVFFHSFTKQSFTPLEQMLDSVSAASFWPESCRAAARLDVQVGPEQTSQILPEPKEVAEHRSSAPRPLLHILAAILVAAVLWA